MTTINELNIYKLKRACAEKVAAIAALTGKPTNEVQIEALRKVVAHDCSGADLYLLARRYVILEQMLLVAQRHAGVPISGLSLAFENLFNGMNEARQAVEALLKRFEGKFGA